MNIESFLLGFYTCGYLIFLFKWSTLCDDPNIPLLVRPFAALIWPFFTGVWIMKMIVGTLYFWEEKG